MIIKIRNLIGAAFIAADSFLRKEEHYIERLEDELDQVNEEIERLSRHLSFVRRLHDENEAIIRDVWRVLEGGAATGKTSELVRRVAGLMVEKEMHKATAESRLRRLNEIAASLDIGAAS